MVSINKYRRNFKHGWPLSKGLLVKVSSQIIETNFTSLQCWTSGLKVCVTGIVCQPSND